MSPLQVTLVGVTVAGLFTLTGIYLGTRWTARDVQDRDQRVARQAENDRRHATVQDHLNKLDRGMWHIESRIAGMNAILRVLMPDYRAQLDHDPDRPDPS